MLSVERSERILQTDSEREGNRNGELEREKKGGEKERAKGEELSGRLVYLRQPERFPECTDADARYVPLHLAQHDYIVVLIGISKRIKLVLSNVTTGQFCLKKRPLTDVKS